MTVEITARHMEATAPLQEYARGKGDVLKVSFPRLENVHIILDVQKHRHTATFVVQAKNRIRTEAEESSDNMRAAIDAAFDKIERQLRRRRDRVQDHKAAMKLEEQEKDRRL